MKLGTNQESAFHPPVIRWDFQVALTSTLLATKHGGTNFNFRSVPQFATQSLVVLTKRKYFTG